MKMRLRFCDGDMTVNTQIPYRGLAQLPAGGLSRMKMDTGASSAAARNGKHVKAA